MGKNSTRLSNGLLNVALVVCGLALAVLLYALVTHPLAPRAGGQQDGEAAGGAEDILQVEVRNGCGVSGLAAEMTHYLRAHGFDVVEVGDHTTFDLERSLVVDRVGDLAAARRIAAALGLPDDRVVQDVRRDYYLDASVLIGKDYATLKPFEKE